MCLENFEQARRYCRRLGSYMMCAMSCIERRGQNNSSDSLIKAADEVLNSVEFPKSPKLSSSRRSFISVVKFRAGTPYPEKRKAVPGECSKKLNHGRQIQWGGIASSVSQEGHFIQWPNGDAHVSVYKQSGLLWLGGVLMENAIPVMVSDFTVVPVKSKPFFISFSCHQSAGVGPERAPPLSREQPHIP